MSSLSEKLTKINPTIIVSRTDRIGDLVLSLPAISKLRIMYPKAKIISLVRSYNSDIVKNSDSIDAHICVDKYNFKELKKKIISLKADVFIALYNDTTTAKLARASKAPFRVGPLSKMNSYFTYNYGVRQKRSHSIKNESEYNLDLIKHLNSKLYTTTVTAKTRISYGQSEKANIEEFLSNNNVKNNFIVIHAFSGGSAYNLSLEQYKELAASLTRKNSSISIIFSASANDKDECERLVSSLNSSQVVSFVNSQSILNLVALIDKCSLFIGGSTGPTHIAGNLKKRLVAFYPCRATMSPTRWGVGVQNSKEVLYIQPEMPTLKYDKALDNFSTIDIKKLCAKITFFYHKVN